jgi:hypothetical protein
VSRGMALLASSEGNPEKEKQPKKKKKENKRLLEGGKKITYAICVALFFHLLFRPPGPLRR